MKFVVNRGMLTTVTVTVDSGDSGRSFTMTARISGVFICSSKVHRCTLYSDDGVRRWAAGFVDVLGRYGLSIDPDPEVLMAEVAAEIWKALARVEVS